jgi:cell division protein FtsQ
MNKLVYRAGTCHGQRGFGVSIALIVLLFVMALAGTIWVSMGVVAKERWPIRWLEVQGGFQRVSAEQLRASLIPLINTSFFTLDLRGLHQAASRNPWVSSIRVEKMWPDTVVVHVTEYVPLAHWNKGSLISTEGEAFNVPEADNIQGLPWLYAPPGRLNEVLEHWTRFSEQLSFAGLEIDSLRLDRRGAWSLTLSNGTSVQLGREAVAMRLDRLMSSWGLLTADSIQLPRDVDLRYSNGFAVLWPQPDMKVTDT